MTKKLKNISELPSWFNIENYVAAKNLSAMGWYAHLYVRKAYARFSSSLYFDGPYIDFTDPETFKFHKKGAEITEEFKALLEFIRANPVSDLAECPLFSSCFHGEPFNEVSRKREHYLHPIHPTTPFELKMLEESLDPDKKNELQQERYWEKDWAHQPVRDISSLAEYPFNNGLEIATINLSLPNEILINQFKEYLKDCRQKRKIPPKNHINALDKWCALGVLPYLDLAIWAERENKSIPDRIMAEAIYPLTFEGEYSEESVRKTLRPLVELLLSSSSFNQLRALAGLYITNGIGSS